LKRILNIYEVLSYEREQGDQIVKLFTLGIVFKITETEVAQIFGLLLPTVPGLPDFSWYVRAKQVK
jgi:hypothetical protein